MKFSDKCMELENTMSRVIQTHKDRCRVLSLSAVPSSKSSTVSMQHRATTGTERSNRPL